MGFCFKLSSGRSGHFCRSSMRVGLIVVLFKRAQTMSPTIGRDEDAVLPAASGVV
jgi:hypothetical protein